MTVVPLNLQRWLEGRLENSGWGRVASIVPGDRQRQERISIWLSADCSRLAIVWPCATRIIDLTIAPEHDPGRGEYRNTAMGLSQVIQDHGLRDESVS